MLPMYTNYSAQLHIPLTGIKQLCGRKIPASSSGGCLECTSSHTLTTPSQSDIYVDYDNFLDENHINHA